MSGEGFTLEGFDDTVLELENVLVLVFLLNFEGHRLSRLLV